MTERAAASKKTTTAKKKTTKKKTSTAIKLTAKEKKLVQNYRKCSVLEKMIFDVLMEKAAGGLTKDIDLQRLIEQ
ncbi:MAG: hypothetical protein IJ120_08245 [Solobacterium sp.]|nr:hypothetical protein [Solobacterium sp.]